MTGTNMVAWEQSFTPGGPFQSLCSTTMEDMSALLACFRRQSFLCKDSGNNSPRRVFRVDEGWEYWSAQCVQPNFLESCQTLIWQTALQMPLLHLYFVHLFERYFREDQCVRSCFAHGQTAFLGKLWDQVVLQLNMFNICWSHFCQCVTLSLSTF